MGSERLSAGDIDGAARLYGKPPTATAISTHPPGLEIVVDGERIVTPARFVRSPGSQHALPALSPQTMGAERFVCGRWNGEGGSRRSVTAGPASTWFAAHCIVQRRTLGCADPPAVEAHPAAGSSRDFLHWGPAPDLAIPRGQAQRSVIPGTSSNPASGCACTWSRWSSDGSRLSDSAAIHSAQPRLRVVSNVDGIAILADGASKRLPRASPTGACPRGVTLEAPATVPDEANQDDDLRNHDMRCRFHSWSDGESRSHEVAVPATDGRVRLKLTHEYRLRTSARNQTDKNHVAIDISPPFEDGFYADS